MPYIYISKSQQFQKGIITKLGYTSCYNCRHIGHSTSNPDFNLHKVFKINSNDHDLAYSIEQHFHKYCQYAKYLGIRGLCEEWYLTLENELEQELICVFDGFRTTHEFSIDLVDIKDSCDHKNCEGDVRQNSLPKILMDDVKLPFELNRFQKIAISKFDNNNALFVMATGSGKTLAALVCCTRWIRNNPGKKILWISRFSDTFNSQIQDFKLVNIPFTIYENTPNHLLSKLNIMSNDRFMIIANNIKIFDEIGLIVFDECHNINGDMTYNCLKYVLENQLIRGNKIQTLGLTATPYYQNSPQLRQRVDEIFIHKHIIVTLPKLIIEGLAPKFNIVYFFDDELMLKLDNKKKVIFCRNKKHMIEVLDKLNKLKEESKSDLLILTSDSIDDQDCKNISTFIEMKNNPTYLLVLKRFKQGTNDPWIEEIIDFVGDHEIHDYIQMIGRLIRPGPIKEKIYNKFVKLSANETIEDRKDRIASQDVMELAKYFAELYETIISHYDLITSRVNYLYMGKTFASVALHSDYYQKLNKIKNKILDQRSITSDEINYMFAQYKTKDEKSNCVIR